MSIFWGGFGDKILLDKKDRYRGPASEVNVSKTNFRIGGNVLCKFKTVASKISI